MASPVSEGTRSGSAFSSRSLEILSETIHIIIDKNRNAARFIIAYTINADSSGKQMPLLFVAQDYKDSFTVWVDGQPVTISNIPGEYTGQAGFPLSQFSNIFRQDNSNNNYVFIRWEENTKYGYRVNDLKYFETTLTAGTHTIQVEYNAKPWIDRSELVRKTSFRYSLTPAEYWRSFGSLDIIVEQEGDAAVYTTNLGNPIEGKTGAVNKWHFNKLPAEYIELVFKPALKQPASFAASLRPYMLLIIGGVLFIIHILLTRWYRRRNPGKRFSPVVILGSLLLPVLAIVGDLRFTRIVDDLIGADASRYHGYDFVILLLLPLVIPIYWLLMWQLDKKYKRSLQRKTAGTT